MRRDRRPVWLAGGLAVVVVLAKVAHLWLRPPVDPFETVLRQAALVMVGLLVVWRLVGRERLARVMGLRLPARARRWAWTVGPAVAVLGVWLVVAGLRGGPIPVSWPDAARIVLATGFGEEFLFRGAVYGLAIRSSRRLAVGLSSVAFGWWHVFDALATVPRVWPGPAAVGFVAGTVVLMTVVGVVVFAPLRRVSGSAWGPALFHASWNLGATLALGQLVVTHV